MPHRITYILDAINHFTQNIHHHWNEVLNYSLPSVFAIGAYSIEHTNQNLISEDSQKWNNFSHFVLVFSFGFTLFKVCREIYKYRLRVKENAK